MAVERLKGEARHFVFICSRKFYFYHGQVSTLRVREFGKVSFVATIPILSISLNSALRRQGNQASYTSNCLFFL